MALSLLLAGLFLGALFRVVFLTTTFLVTTTLTVVFLLDTEAFLADAFLRLAAASLLLLVTEAFLIAAVLRVTTLLLMVPLFGLFFLVEVATLFLDVLAFLVIRLVADFFLETALLEETFFEEDADLFETFPADRRAVDLERACLGILLKSIFFLK